MFILRSLNTDFDVPIFLAIDERASINIKNIAKS